MGSCTKIVKEQILAFFLTHSTYTNSNNLMRDYNDLSSIVLLHRDICSKDDIHDIFISIMDEIEMNDYQDEIMIEVSNRLDRSLPPFIEPFLL